MNTADQETQDEIAANGSADDSGNKEMVNAVEVERVNSRVVEGGAVKEDADGAKKGRRDKKKTGREEKQPSGQTAKMDKKQPMLKESSRLRLTTPPFDHAPGPIKPPSQPDRVE
jgi:hypothetical protein